MEGEHDQTAAEAEVEDRRHRVMALRLRRMSEKAIAAILQVSQPTVSRDLNWIREHWLERYGMPAGIVASEEIGEAIALFEDAEAAALLEYHHLKDAAASRRLSPIFISRQRMACLRTAMKARELHVNLLLNLGLLDRQIGNVGVTRRADAIRQALRDAGLLVMDRATITVGQDEEDDEVKRRLRQVG